ncbi:uncharacterized protein LOC144427196 isoform X2 [Styela clava]
MNIVVILALCLATYVAEAESHAIDSECRLPVTNKIDFAQLREKNWYTTSHNKYSRSRTDVCVVISDVEETNGGLEFQYEMFNNSGIVKNFKIHTTLHPSGKYTWEPASETGKDPFSPTDAKTEMEKERDHIGKQNVWIYTPTQYPTADDNIRIYNRLLDVGFRSNDIYLVSLSCAVMQPININSK